MANTLAMICLDCAEVGPVSAFWAALLDLEVAYGDDDYAMLTGAGTRMGFDRIEGYQPPSWPDEAGGKRYHLDIAVDDIPAAEARALELGATLADPQTGETWRVLIDPAGHPFCLTDAANW